MKIEDKCVVQVHYKLQEDDVNGKVVEDTAGKDPLTFLTGIGMMIPDFEKNIQGKEVGDECQFGIKAADAYGEQNPEAIADIPKTVFVVDGKEATELMHVGQHVPMQDQEGRPMNGTVVEVNETHLKVDFNHPMAGTNLYFTVKVESIRAASEEELAHGHVHGPGGHQH